ncbi:nitrile hydratase accessory protein [Kiloniella laminariae]|uniref:Nitrile hydratase accessory protein n=1 Tax=Kiloniella laminariae TaxID=454162 RepID=A0ABT4LFZ9_9PROT|nr:nitrile hydratase accessory protein [Kiloniella laminariae]MCZ4280027.1 nitrile hydratase accessory protein [Kiloniella laminariae]
MDKDPGSVLGQPTKSEEVPLTLCKGLPDLPRDEDGPVFAEPWQAQAFALAVRLCDQGHFTWAEWVENFSAEIKRAQAAGDPDLGNTYYDHWLAVLEKIITDKGILQTPDLLSRKEQWRQAYLSTPHGKAVEL